MTEKKLAVETVRSILNDLPFDDIMIVMTVARTLRRINQENAAKAEGGDAA